MPRRLPSWLTPVLTGLVFLLTGLALLPWPGLQNDELFFTGPIYAPGEAFYHFDAGSWRIPFMVMSYSGALKTWLYAGLFLFLKPNQGAVRLPMLLLGVCTIWLTWAWVRRIAGERAAAVAAVLLATDTIFLLTNLFDWGPVALQHFLLMAGLLAFDHWRKSEANPALALAFLFWGLGMWDKALMAWPLIGMFVGLFCIFPREALRRVRFAPAAIAVSMFLLGAAPLVWYNLARPGETAKQNAKFTLRDVKGKLTVLTQTVDGSALFGYLVYEDSTPAKRVPRKLVERIPVALSKLAGNHRSNWMLVAWAIGFGFSFTLWNTPLRRTLLWLLTTMLVIWAQMALTKGTGGAAHHVVLMWPFPAVFLGIVFSAVSEKLSRFGTPALTVLVILFAGENLLTTNQYLAQFVVNGGSGGWTDAVRPLADSLDRKSAAWFGLVDWGYLNAIRMFRGGDIPVFFVDPNAGPEEFLRQIGNPDFQFVQHTDDKQIFPGVNDRLRKAALAAGYAERIERTIPDRNGRPVFELFRFQKLADSSAMIPSRTPAIE
jgi:hypothetical protein